MKTLNILASIATFRCIFGQGVCLMILCSCKPESNLSPKAIEFRQITSSVTNSEVILETGVAHDFLDQLYDQGRLPGISTDEVGQVSCDLPGLVISNKLAEMTYPALRTFHLVKTGETSTNNYTLVKTSKDSAWQLQKAWRVDAAGHTIEEWPIK
jgi:hypothetical protein